jgi:hypothetical protein
VCSKTDLKSRRKYDVGSKTFSPKPLYVIIKKITKYFEDKFKQTRLMADFSSLIKWGGGEER